MLVTSRNISFATVESIGALMDTGKEVTVGKDRTKELIHQVTVLERPLERFLFVPERRNDVFAQIAEALWVAAGRNDIEWLSRYLHRAAEFSQDGGRTWQGAYGPRLRRWSHAGIDQVAHVKRILSEDPASRRAVMSLFDPETDLTGTADIPCNNWLSWIVRDGRLHLAVAVRSNDVMWGFSGANAFEWSVLHEMLAHWLGVAVGSQTWIASSFHVYERHWSRAARITESFHRLTPYDFGVTRAEFRTSWDDLDRTLSSWFEAEAAMAADPDAPIPQGVAVTDPFLKACLHALRIRCGSASWGEDRLRKELAGLPHTDVAAAVWEHFSRDEPGRLAALKPGGLAEFFAAGATPGAPDQRFRQGIKRLHARKDRLYGAAWKRRGELVSVLPNVARKVDRLEVFLKDGIRAGDEAVLDTAIDLYVYATKYRLLLEEREEPSGLLPPDAASPFSDHDENFEGLVDGDGFEDGAVDPGPGIRNGVDLFERLWRSATDGASLVVIRDLSDQLRDAARRIVADAAYGKPAAVSAFSATEARYREEGERS
ncbi:thymidylate synthase [Methylobacterium oryzae]|uniref:Thymidylate synthase/dCMP hydroxymethylase domain-containing protein n=1 Tax=Methylobacterium oryzae TaxID=334852 RepID=A0ABU7TS04_9HYPH